MRKRCTPSTYIFTVANLWSFYSNGSFHIHLRQRFRLILPIGGSQCDSYPCGTRKCTNIAWHSYACELLSGHMTCGFEQWDTQCSAMLNITVSGDDYDPIYNTGERIYLQCRYAQSKHSYFFWLFILPSFAYWFFTCSWWVLGEGSLRAATVMYKAYCQALKHERGEHYACDAIAQSTRSSVCLLLWRIFHAFVVVGGTPSIGTGPSSAHNGTSYLYFEATERKFNDTAYVRINPMTHTDKIISLYYNGYGAKYVYICLNLIYALCFKKFCITKWVKSGQLPDCILSNSTLCKPRLACQPSMHQAGFWAKSNWIQAGKEGFRPTYHIVWYTFAFNGLLCCE